jgi:hypothetical protein
MMAVTNKQLLISESRGDSNRCTPCRGKLNQHDTYASHASPHTSGVCFCGQSPYVVTFHTVINRLEQIHCPREEGLPTQSTTHQLTDLWVRPSFSPTTANEAVEKSQASIDNWLLGLLKDQRRRPEEGEWEPIKIPCRNLDYIPKSTQSPSLLTRPRPPNYR